MEMLGVRQFNDIFRGKRVLITGNTGFKGSWLSLWLKELGAEVFGIALKPESSPNHWELLNLDIHHTNADIRDYPKLAQLVSEIQPEIVFHLAAQPLVRRSYSDPVETWTTNVTGTVNVLEACRSTPSCRAVLVVTTDKCYENQEWYWGYRENDRLGGHDPYSASKACAELVVSSYKSSFFKDNGILTASARAGNVIGGGDWSENRLIPDLIRAIGSNKQLEIRSPGATRPWQHVLESLSGYLLLGQNLLEGNEAFSEAWNFGPDQEGNRSVEDILLRISTHFEHINWYISENIQLHESTLLYLDTSKSRTKLKWQPVWDLHTTLAKTADWYKSLMNKGEVLSRAQLSDYVNTALQKKLCWVQV